ncbi:undecaprenyldiphospho-muramoylpentapeptide beta-N-acetylglucosaminyltransferase [Clostridium septicum]|uniref:UDP-N-acetylglucosamine--N-acetylmuramyl-(pentapeptide) pyrophosphoryl-undecaprenol N-acetylglucosamine transferase n=1 Tax=Clostridium septicum TaxID=1504 RepID=A0A9N7JK04_CLOSE|nr:undecaprenyldiphospho-muramoylpentapeptide beta-N-acetylglucosaminyltransferase [Clostridium septicum]AYE33470.1 undecaprenyldiphospho-muramoylpentapeptide beta-N-acetylglucosaminyltransferase [Clostridium septicum]MDU1314789.1 undecaprenyldiphospho-muramoylpentapeptide beta-N-acetylglucosaminyltransferase [Clostridium septicum]QAS61641.1 undecaprenyldiphospho-muramoylpentapeptide beta-N-acetylglucosaminyltransferase [Clostridium septicum]UEC21921.1 undecaprenyldiphospho-muramoylpentapeptide
MSKYKIIMTGGGTAGHVTPNLALVPKLKEKGFEVKYIGSKTGIEKEIITDAKIPYYEISSGKLRRYFDFKNFTDPFKVMKGILEAKKILKEEKPDVIFSKGGFVAVPVVIAASMKKIPVVSHESDLTPGLANKLSAPFCNRLCVTFRESLNYIKDGKGVLTGTPIRHEILEGSKLRGKEICGFKDNKDILLVIGGSLGAKSINEEIRRDLDEILKMFNVIHVCGKGNLDKKLENTVGYKQFEYVKEDLPHLLKSANFVVSRAGANVIFELLALKKPTLLIPLSKKISRGDQILNANSFEKEGYSLVLDEDEMQESHNLIIKLKELKEKSNYLAKNMENSNLKNGVDAILEVILNSMELNM